MTYDVGINSHSCLVKETLRELGVRDGSICSGGKREELRGIEIYYDPEGEGSGQSGPKERDTTERDL